MVIILKLKVKMEMNIKKTFFIQILKDLFMIYKKKLKNYIKCTCYLKIRKSGRL